MYNEPAQLNLLKKLQEATTNDVDEERGSFKKGDKVTYDMLGGGLTDSDLIRTLGTNEHTTRANHNEAIAEIVEAIGKAVARYSIMFEDGFVINDVATSELKSIEEAVFAVGQKVSVADKDSSYYLAKGHVLISNSYVLVELDDGQRIKLSAWQLRSLSESKTNEAEEATDTMKPQEKPNIKAEDYHMEDYSEDDLEKVKSKSAETGNAIRQVDDKELKIEPDKVVTPKKESKLKEQKEGQFISIPRGSVFVEPGDKIEALGDTYTVKQIGSKYLIVVDSHDEESTVAISDIDDVIGESKLKEGRGEEIYQEALEFTKGEILKQMKDHRSYDEFVIRDKLMEEFSLTEQDAEDIVMDAASSDELDLGDQPSFESKLKEETEFTPSRAEMKKISDDKLQELYKNALRSQEYWAKDRTVPEKAELAKQAVERYKEELVSRGIITGVEVPNETKESKFSFMKKQKPLWLCTECHKTFRADKGICENCKSENTEKIIKEQTTGFTKEVFQVTWKNTDTGKEESTRVMAFDKADAKKEVKRSNREITKVEGPITKEAKEEDKAPFDESSEGSKVDEDVNTKYEYLWGLYSKFGYTILGKRKDGTIDELYRAGNHSRDSAQVLPPGHHSALDIDTIRKFCKETGKETAEEHNVRWRGVLVKESKLKEEKDKPTLRQQQDVMARLQYGKSWYKDLSPEEKKEVNSKLADYKESKLHETVRELVGEVSGIDKEEQKILIQAIEKGDILNIWPSDETMIDKLSADPAVSKIHSRKDIDGLDMGEIRFAYLKYILLPKAKEVVGTADESKLSEQEVEGVPEKGQTYSIHPTSGVNFPDGNYEVTDVSYRWTVKGDLAKHFQVAGDDKWWIAKFYGFKEVASESKINEEEDWDLSFMYSHNLIWHNPLVDHKGTYFHWQKQRIAGKKVRVFTDYQAEWVERNKAIPVKVDYEPIPEAKEIKPVTTIEIVRSQLDPEAYNIRAVELPAGSIEMLDSVSDRTEAIKRGKEFARQFNAKFLGIIDEKKIEEEDEKYITKVKYKELVGKAREDFKRLFPYYSDEEVEKLVKDYATAAARKTKEVESKLKEGGSYKTFAQIIPDYIRKGSVKRFEIEKLIRSKPFYANLLDDETVMQALFDELEGMGYTVEESLKEQEEDIFTTVAKGIIDKADADKLAKEKEGQVIQDEEDKAKFAVLVRTEQ